MATLNGNAGFLINGGSGSPSLPPLTRNFPGPGQNTAVISNRLTVNSGLYDITNPQYSIRFKPGTVNRHYRYIGPIVTLTDTFSGSLKLSSQIGAFPATTATITLTKNTLAQWAAAINTQFAGYALAQVIQYGTVGYLVINSTETTPSAVNNTSDTVLTMTPTLTDDNDPYLNVQFIPLISNAMGVQTTGNYQWAVAMRDPISGHLSNLSPFSSIASLPFGSEINLSIMTQFNYAAYGYVMEVYRTSADGSSMLFLGMASYQGETFVSTRPAGNYLYTFRDTYTDDFLNQDLVGPVDEANDPPPTPIHGLVSYQGRLWGISKNRVYYSGGPDTTNGNGNEAWPPSNYFEYPGNPVLLLPTSSGLSVFLKDDVHNIEGVDSSSYYSKLWISGFGISNPYAALVDGQTIYVYTTKQQLHALSPSNQNEIGFPVGDLLLENFPAGSTNLTFHRNSALDTALYIANGQDTFMRYDPRSKAWSTPAMPLFGANRVRSLETSVGVQKLLVSTPPGAASSQVFYRDPTTFADNNAAFQAFATIGVMMVAEPGSIQNFDHVAVQLRNRGTIPTIWLLNNEIDDSLVPFSQLFNPQPDPPLLLNSNSIWQKRWYLKSTQNKSLPMIVNLVSVKIQFATEAAQNEVLGVYLRNAP